MGEACSFRLAKMAWWMCHLGSTESFVPELWCFRASSCLVFRSEWSCPVLLCSRAASPFRALRYLPAEWPSRRAELPFQQVVWQCRAWQSLYPVRVLEQPSGASLSPARESRRLELSSGPPFLTRLLARFRPMTDFAPPATSHNTKSRTVVN